MKAKLSLVRELNATGSAFAGCGTPTSTALPRHGGDDYAGPLRVMPVAEVALAAAPDAIPRR